MKKIIAALLVGLLLLVPASLAEDAMAELRGMRKSAEDAIVAIEAPEVTPSPPTPEPTPTPTPDPTEYEPLAKGAQGETVRKMQAKLIELGCLDGSADGIYGNKTEQAVKAFQRSANLEATGAADADTQRALYAAKVSQAQQYQALNFKELSAGGAQSEGCMVKFTGRVMQVLTDDTYADTVGIYTVMRVATRGKCYDAVVVYGFRSANQRAIAEGDLVRVWGTTRGRMQYESVSGKDVTVPQIEADTVLWE